MKSHKYRNETVKALWFGIVSAVMLSSLMTGIALITIAVLRHQELAIWQTSGLVIYGLALFVLFVISLLVWISDYDDHRQEISRGSK